MTEISDYIIKEINPLCTDESIETAQDLFLEFPYSHFPIVENGIYIGCIGAHDVELLDHDMKIGDFRYTFERFFARKDTMWLDVLEVLPRTKPIWFRYWTTTTTIWVITKWTTSSVFSTKPHFYGKKAVSLSSKKAQKNTA